MSKKNTYGQDDEDLPHGGQVDDALLETYWDDRLRGHKGDDLLAGLGGNDRLYGGKGDDFLTGGSGSDRLQGDKGRDMLLGGRGDDRLQGGQGDDLIAGGAGNDAIDGGNGFDTARFSGNYADYRIRIEGNGRGESGFRVTVVDLRGIDGCDELRRVEALQFADRTIVLGEGDGNQTPSAGGDALETDEDVQIVIPAAMLLANDADPDGDALQLVSVTSGTGASVALDADGNVVVTPLAHFSGQASFSYTVADGQGGTATGTVVVSITAVADAPVLGAGDAAGAEDTAIALPISAALVDTDGSEFLSVVLDGLPPGSMLSAGELRNGQWWLSAADLPGLTATPPSDYHGTFTVTATATATEPSNGDAATRSVTFSVTVASVNDAPVAVDDSSGVDAVIEAGVAPGDPSASGNVLANDIDLDAGDVLSVVPGTFAGTYGSLMMAADGHWTYTLHNADPDTNALAQGESVTEVFAYVATDAWGATSSAALTVTVTGGNDAPVVSGATSGAVREDTVLQTGGQLTASDPDHGATRTWSIVGATPAHGASYRFAAEDLTILKFGSTFFADTFSDGVPPSTAASGGLSYSVIGGLTEANGQLVLDSGAAAATGLMGIAEPTLGHAAIVRSSFDADLSIGLKSDDDFSVSARFDLVLPDDRREAYGIRLSDRLTGSGTPADQPGDDTLDLVVRRDLDGTVRVRLAEVDFAAGQYNLLQGIALDPLTAADQIVLRMTHEAAQMGRIVASFDLLQGGAVVASHSFSPEGARIFGTETPGTTLDDEVWTRAGIVAYSPQTIDAALKGSYGSLVLNQAGGWTYALSNSQPNVQALAEGQVVQDVFTVQATDEHGASGTRTVSIAVTGTAEPGNLAPHDITASDLSCRIVESTPVGTVLGTFTGLDADDASDTLTLSLVDDAGGRFTLQGNQLVLARELDVDDLGALPQPFIRVRVADPDGAFYEEQFNLAYGNSNEAPTDIELIYYYAGPFEPEFPENMPLGTVIGHLWAFDPEGYDQFSFSLVDDSGGRFRIVDNALVVNGYLPGLVWNLPGPGIPELSLPDPTPQVTVRATDSRGLSVERTFDVEIFPRIGPSTFDIQLADNLTISEYNEPDGAVSWVHVAGVPAGLEPTVTLTGNAGGRFYLDGTVIRHHDRLDYEQAPILTSGGRGYELTLHAGWGIYGVSETFTVRMIDWNEVSSPARLQINWLPENETPGWMGSVHLHPDFPYPGMPSVFSLIDDAGGAFSIIDNQLHANRTFDHELQSIYTIRVETLNELGRFQTYVNIEVVDVNEAPYNIYVFENGLRSEHATSIIENAPAGGYITRIGVDDPDRFDTEWRLTLPGGEAGPFYILGQDLYVKGPLDFETTPYYDLTIQAVDARGRSYQETIRVNVLDQPGLVQTALEPGQMLFGGPEADWLTGSSGDDILDGNGADDVLLGGPGRDILRGGMGNDVIHGGLDYDPNDPLWYDDIDYLSYSASPGPVTLALAAGTASAFDEGNDTFSSIEGVIGSRFDDFLIGGGNPTLELFRGGHGNDTLSGGGGLDRAEYRDATPGEDSSGITVRLAAGTVMGQGVLFDTLLDIEEIEGSAYNDLYDATGFGFDGPNFGSLGTYNSFRPGAGDDALIGNGNSRLDYQDAGDCVHVDLATGIVEGSAAIGRDTFSGVNRVRGSMFGDELVGSGNPAGTFERFEGAGGADYIDGRGGFDIAAYHTDGNITLGLVVNLAAGTVLGDPLRTGADVLRSIEAIDGSILADVFNAAGFSGSSMNAGSLGTLNEFQGRAGNDIVTGNGNTRVSYADATSGVSVHLTQGWATGDASVGTDSFTGGVTRVRGSQFDDLIRGNAGNNVLEGMGGNDSLYGDAGNDTLFGGGGSDVFILTQGGDVDTVGDFQAGFGGDRLDIRDLLTDFDPDMPSSFVNLNPAGGDTTLLVDRDGEGTSHVFQAVAVLDNVTIMDLNQLNLIMY